MSTKRSNTSEYKPVANSGAPMIGSLLRLPREHVVARMLVEVNENGFDVTETELNVFMHPGPDGRRPVELARQCNMSRQAMNYVLAGLERRGYLARRADSSPTSAVIQMMPRGWEMYARMRTTVAAIEQEWISYLGEERFNTMREILVDLSTWLGSVQR